MVQVLVLRTAFLHTETMGTSSRNPSRGQRDMTLIPAARLACDCTITYSSITKTPARGETIYCPRHADYQAVAHAPAKYSIRCIVCRYSRASFGHVRFSAETAALDHVKKCRGHTVELYDGMIKEWTYTTPQLLDTTPHEPPY